MRVWLLMMTKASLIVPVRIAVRFYILLIIVTMSLKFIKRQRQRNGIIIEVANVQLKLSHAVNGIIAVIAEGHRREVPGHVSRADPRREKADIDTGLKPALTSQKVVIFVICALLMVVRDLSYIAAELHPRSTSFGKRTQRLL